MHNLSYNLLIKYFIVYILYIILAFMFLGCHLFKFNYSGDGEFIDNGLSSGWPQYILTVDKGIRLDNISTRSYRIGRLPTLFLYSEKNFWIGLEHKAIIKSGDYEFSNQSDILSRDFANKEAFNIEFAKIESGSVKISIEIYNSNTKEKLYSYDGDIKSLMRSSYRRDNTFYLFDYFPYNFSEKSIERIIELKIIDPYIPPDGIYKTMKTPEFNLVIKGGGGGM